MDFCCREDQMVARLAEKLALEYGMHPELAGHIFKAALLHDVGKIFLPQSILEKPDQLDEREYEVVKTHTSQGAKLLSGIEGSFGEVARQTALYHHEWYDGTGYWGKFADELPAYVPMVTIADIFTALIHERPYKRAWLLEEALDYIRKHAGIRFNPGLVEAFLPLAREEGKKAIYPPTKGV